MNFIRFFLACLVRVLVLVAMLVAAAFAPPVQTWFARREIFRQPGLSGSLGSLSARFGHVEIEDLKVDSGGAVLTLPSLEANLPLLMAWHRKVMVHTLVAHGWTLDLSDASRKAAQPRPAAPAPATGGEAEPMDEPNGEPAQRAAAFFRGILGEWRLPCDLALDGVDLEGDVLVATPSRRAPVRVHVVVKGGGMAAGRDGSFAVDATVADSMLPVSNVAAHGSLAVAMDSPRTLSRLEFKADLSARGGSLPKEVDLSADFETARSAGDEAYNLDLSRGGTHVATLVTRYPAATHRLEGTWKIALADSDLAPFTLDHPLPAFTAAGEGQFDADTAFAHVHALGRLAAAASRLEVLAPPLERLGAVKIDAQFDATQTGPSLRVDHLSVSLAGSGPSGSVQALQPFDFDTQARALKVADPGADWLDVSIRGFPLAWLSDPSDRLVFAGDAAGEFVARAANDGFSVRGKAPLLATGVSVKGADRTFAHGLDLSLALQADYSPQGWQVQSAPLLVSSGGRQLATIEAKASQAAGPDQPIEVAGSWKAEVAALAAASGLQGGSPLPGGSASGDFSAKVGSATEFDAKLAVSGADPEHSLTASVGGEINADGGVSFVAPIKIAFGPSVSEMSAEGTWSGPGTGSRFDFKLTSESVALEQLRLLARPLAAAGGAHLPGAATDERDRVPFWGNWVGHVTVAFDHVRTPERDFADVGGGIEIGPSSIQLEGGRAELFGQRKVRAGDASLSFDPAAALPYSLKATAGIDKIAAVSLFGATPHGQQPVLEGHFAIVGTLAGSGINMRDLASRAQLELRLTSADGILRLLATSVAESIPEVATPVKDALGAVGHTVGSILQVKRTANGDKNPVTPTAEAVLNFTTEISEIGYDLITVTARRGADGTIQLADLVVNAPDVRLTGSGRIEADAGRPFPARPLSLELQLGAKDQIAELLSRAGLLSPRKDGLGYTMLNQPFRLGGTLAQVDVRAWHDLLAAAATRKPASAK